MLDPGTPSKPWFRCACRAALQARDHAALAALMDRNFDLRRQMFGDAALGALNLRMVLAARALGGVPCAQGIILTIISKHVLPAGHARPSHGDAGGAQRENAPFKSAGAACAL